VDDFRYPTPYKEVKFLKLDFFGLQPPVALDFKSSISQVDDFRYPTPYKEVKFLKLDFFGLQSAPYPVNLANKMLWNKP